MALNTFNCNYLTPLYFKGLRTAEITGNWYKNLLCNVLHFEHCIVMCVKLFCSYSKLSFSDGVFSQLIHLALGCSFLLVARVHLTCLRGVWQLQSLHSFRQSSINVRPHHHGRQLQSPPGALCQVDWIHLKATTHLRGIIEVARRQRKTKHLPTLPNLVQAGCVLMEHIHTDLDWLLNHCRGRLLVYLFI